MRKMRKLLLVGVVIFIAVAVSLPMFLPSSIWSAPQVAPSEPAPDVKRGAYLFNAGGCASCHTRKGGAHLAGGAELKTPYGVFVAPNITPDARTGIGGWTEKDFLRAMRVGVSPAGRHYYPSFPYTSYTNLTVRDLRDMWAYLRTVKPVNAASKGHRVDFPWDFRPGVGLWKLIWFRPGPFKNHSSKSTVWNRGAYLVLGATHCAECHTSRDGFGGLRRENWLSGAANQSGRGRIPALPPQGWSGLDITAYLQSGFTPEFDVVGGAMADVVASISRLPSEDRNAIAAYLLAFRSSPSR